MSDRPCQQWCQQHRGTTGWPQWGRAVQPIVLLRVWVGLVLINSISGKENIVSTQNTIRDEGSFSRRKQFELCVQSIHTHGKKQRTWKRRTWKTYTVNRFCSSLPSLLWDSVRLHLLFPQNSWLLQYLARVRTTCMQMVIETVFINSQTATGFKEWSHVTLKCTYEVT